MAISLLTNIASALSQRFDKDLARQWNRQTVLGSLIPVQPGFGKNVAWDVLMDGQSAQTYAEGADVQSSEFTVDQPLPATLSWGHYRSAFQVSETQFDAAVTSAGSAAALESLFRERVMSAGTALASKVNVDLWAATGADGSSNPTIVGLFGGALPVAGGTYAGLAVNTYPLWATNNLDNGGNGRPLTMDLMYQAEQNIFTRSGTRPTRIVAHPAVIRKYAGLFESLRRIEGESVSRYDSGPAMLESGETGLYFEGIPLYRDKDAPVGTLLFVNDAHYTVKYLPNSSDAMQDTNMARQFIGAGSNGENSTSIKLPFKIVPLAKTGDSLKFMIKAVVQLQVDTPNAFAYISDIATV